MTFHVYFVQNGVESPIEDGSRGQKGKPAEFTSRGIAEALIADWKKYATFTGGRHDIEHDFIIKEVTHDPK